MSQRPVCVRCACYFRPEKNGIYYVEMKPLAGGDTPRGNRDPGMWVPYKLWQADLWKCPECGHEIIHGAGLEPVSQDYRKEFMDWIEKLGPEIKVLVNDC